MPTYVPVRRGNGPLHIAEPTGHGYRTACGRKLTGPNLSVPLPRIDLGRRHREHWWADRFDADGCRSCAKADPNP